MARLNRDLLEAEISLATVKSEVGELKLAPAPDGRVSASDGGVRVPSFVGPPPLPPLHKGGKEIVRCGVARIVGRARSCGDS